MDPSFFALQLSSYPYMRGRQNRLVTDNPQLPRLFRTLDNTPVIDTHGIGVLYVGPGQSTEAEILRNEHGSPAYTRFLEGIGRLVDLRGQQDIYVGQLRDPELHGRYAYAWWDDIGQVLFHTATMMPTRADDPTCNFKKAPIGNDYVRIVWNDSGLPYAFDTLQTAFQFVNIVIEPHSRGAVFAAFGKPTKTGTTSTTTATNEYDNEYFRVSIQLAPTMTDFSPIGDFAILSAESLPMFVRQVSLLGDWFTRAYVDTDNDTSRREVETNWRRRLVMIKNFRQRIMEEANKEQASEPLPPPGVMGEQAFRDFTSMY
jgi:tuberous sclerosis 2